MNSALLRATYILILLPLVIGGCSSSGPKTKYYALNSSADFVVDSKQGIASIGIGPIVLPEFLDHSSIVSIANENRIVVSGLHAWAGDLDSAIIRVLANTVAAELGTENILSFPWDARIRPEYQLQIVFYDLSGVLGGDVNLKASWMVIHQPSKKLVQQGSELLTQSTSSNSYDSYVKAINQVLNNFSVKLAENIANNVLVDNR